MVNETVRRYSREPDDDDVPYILCPHAKSEDQRTPQANHETVFRGIDIVKGFTE
jgi:hypothetical protein